MSTRRLEAHVRGRVQGVSFRYYTRSQADRLDLTGWVRNEADGAVSVVAEGPETALRQLLAFLHRGPPAANVSQVETRWGSPTGDLPRFEIRW